MTDKTSAADGGLRVAVIDNDSGFLQVLGKRMGRRGGEHRVLTGPTPVETLVAMRVSAVIIDPVLFGPRAFEELERVCAGLPGLGVVVCPGGSTVAQRVRGLRLGADDWVAKPCHPEEVIARAEAVVRRRRRAAGPSERKQVVAGELEIRGDQFQAYVRGQSLDLTRREFELLELLSESAAQ